MPQPLIHGNGSLCRDKAACQFLAIFTVRNPTFSEGRFCSIFVTFRDCWIVYRPGRVQNRSELFAAKRRGGVGVDRAVHMCPNRPNRSPPRGAARAFFKFPELTAPLKPDRI